MLIVGLTGNIACGKSLVSKMLAQLGAEVLDADKVVHELMRKNTEIWQRIVAEFGDRILTNTGEIDRAKLGEIVFADPAALAELERITHPAVIDKIDQAMRKSTAPVFVVEAIKLIESGLHKRCDSVWVVTCRREQQIERLIKERKLSPEAAAARIAAQSPIEEKIKYANVVIDNSGSVDETWAQVKRAWAELIARTGQNAG